MIQERHDNGINLLSIRDFSLRKYNRRRFVVIQLIANSFNLLSVLREGHIRKLSIIYVKLFCHTHNFAWGLRYYFLFTRYIVANHYPELNHVANVGGLSSKTRDVETSTETEFKADKNEG
jgi:hypothetical protein